MLLHGNRSLFTRSGLGRICLVAALVFGFTSSLARATIFDWPSSPGWTAGQPNAGQTKVQSFTSVSTNDITVSINNSGAASQGMQWNGGYPQISATPLTGGSSVNALQLSVQKSQVSTAYVQTTVTFATAVTNLTIQIWDVDALAGQFADKIYNIQALAQGGGVVGASSVASEVAGYNTITGTGLSTVVLGTASADNATNQGTIDISFTGPITQFSFQWANNDPALGQQFIGLGEMSYSIVPEFNTVYAGAGCCSFAIFFERARRRRREG